MKNLAKGYYNSPRWSWEILDCAMPMTFDTYSNCAHQCVYCFAFFQRAIGEAKNDYLMHRVKPVNAQRVKRMFLEPDKYAGQFAWYIKQRMVLQWGGLSDGFDWYERKLRISLDLLRFFREIDYPISISTKGVWFLEDAEYIDAFTDARNVQMKYSIITMNPEHASKLEAGTPSPQERFDALAKLKEMGVGVTTLRFRPYVLGVSDLCVEEMFDAAHQANVDSITTEFLCLESRASGTAKERYELIGEVSRIPNLLEFYRKHSSGSSGLLRLNYDLKRTHFERMERLAEKHGIPFYISDAHHKERSAGTGCCGLPEEGPLSNINRGQYSEAIQIAKRKGSVTWADISELAEGLKNIPYYKAEGYNTGGTPNRAKFAYHTMYDFMRHTWNDIRDVNSPARYFGGVLVPSELDEEGNIIYLFNEPFVKDGYRAQSVKEIKEYYQKVEQQQGDGGEFGHVAYPIYVWCGNRRAGGATTLPLLVSARLNPIAFVGLAQKEEYESLYPQVEIQPVADGLDISAGFQIMIDYSREYGYSAAWLLQSNIKKFIYERNGEMKEGGARVVLSGAEYLFHAYDAVGVLGLNSAKKTRGIFEANVKVGPNILARTDTEMNFRDRGSMVFEDYSLQHLENGWRTIRSNKYKAKFGPIGFDVSNGCVDQFSEDWEPYIVVNERQQVKIYWKLFDLPLSSGIISEAG